MKSFQLQLLAYWLFCIQCNEFFQQRVGNFLRNFVFKCKFNFFFYFSPKKSPIILYHQPKKQKTKNKKTKKPWFYLCRLFLYFVDPSLYLFFVRFFYSLLQISHLTHLFQVPCASRLLLQQFAFFMRILEFEKSNPNQT